MFPLKYSFFVVVFWAVSPRVVFSLEKNYFSLQRYKPVLGEIVPVSIHSSFFTNLNFSKSNFPAERPFFQYGVDATKSEESKLRRGEIIFFISYPFTFLASLATYSLFSYTLTTLEGHTKFAPDGTFYALSAITAAFLSVGVALNDYDAINAQSKDETSYLSWSRRIY